MCIMCEIRKSLNNSDTATQEQRAEDAAKAIAVRLFGAEAVEEALNDPQPASEEDQAFAEMLADAIFGSMFGPEALAQVKEAKREEEQEEPKGIPLSDLIGMVKQIKTDMADQPRHAQAEHFADRVYAQLFGDEALAKTKADPQVQAFLASKRAEEEAKAQSVGEPPKTAPEFLERARQHMLDRAVTYDNPEGERSMAKTVELFNTLRDQNLTEADGWTFMALLKMVRANQGEFKSDNFEDLVAYSALLGESEAKAA